MFDEEYYEQFQPMPRQLEEVQSLISDYAKTIAKDIVDNNKHLKVQNKKLRKEVSELQRFKNKCAELEVDLQKKQKSYSKDCAMEYLANNAGLDGIKYGDTLYTVYGERHSEVCTECHGNKKVQMTYKGEETDITCPKCDGNHAYVFYTYHVKKVKVVGFSVSAVDGRDSGQALLTTNLTLSDGTKNSYGDVIAKNYHPSGLNSDNYYSGWYKTKKDAVKYCEKEITELGRI